MIVKPRLPIITLILIVANLFAAFYLAFDAELAMDLGFNPKNPKFITLFSSLFLHQNLLHLLGNMVFLAAVGAAVELATGSARFLVVYLVSGLLGVLAHFLFTMSLREPSVMIGASGSVAGCAAYYSVRYTQLKVPIAPKKGLSVAVVTLVWLVLQFIGVFVHIGESSNVSFWAHIGGFLGGLLLSAVFRAPDLGQRKLGHDVLDQMNERGPAAVAVAARQHLKGHPGDVRAMKDLAEAEKQLGHPIAEVETLLKLLEILPESEQTEPLLRLGEMEKLAMLPSLRRTLLADRYREADPETCRMLLTSVVEGPESDPQIPDAMLALASLDFDQAPEQAQVVLARLVATYPLHPTVNLARQRGWIS
ncbi:MAG: rhomboid family intramembrane serine protease [Chlorobia bacterium]|nr:rhomboid family intramembrane serine protease [Fimbriimonadaceae bacterium]